MSEIPEENYLDFQVHSGIKKGSDIIYADEVRQHDLELISKKNGKKYNFVGFKDIRDDLPENIRRQISTLEGWLTIRNDLRFVNENIEFILNSDLDDRWLKVIQSMYFSIIVTYGKCFNTANGRATLNKKTCFKKNKEAEEIHDHMIGVRNNYVAHGAVGYNSETEVFYAIEKGELEHSDRRIESISAAISFPNWDLLRKYQAVVHTVHDKLNNSIWSLQKTIQSRVESIYTLEELRKLAKYSNS
ncbi:hypothetical protein [Alteromonas gilva]|uniref:Apea-like HEPN domain-containing protein n=1 Tax=Alteromonas gilva TaxID=2987522 RepID=A0ABT5L0I3_9ALTE|nr:hypothetical protein [Alteromonas gilva]MDC8829387.1 hypothetical protein [Alteromonas gilva]